MKGELTKALVTAGVTCHIVRTPTWLVDVSPRWPRDPFRGARRARRAVRAIHGLAEWAPILQKARPDLVVSSTTFSPTPALASRRASIPHIWWIHEFTTFGLGKRYALGESLSQRLIGRYSNVVAVNSGAVANHYSPPIPRSKIAVIELGVEPRKVEPNALVDQSLRMLMLGRKEPQKGCEIALRALAMLYHERTNVTLRMVGPGLGDYSTQLWYLARDLGILERVEFIEYAPDPHDHLEWCNVVLVPSYGEGFGRVTVEALKSGRPVLAAHAGATVELVEHERNGLFFEPGDVAGFAAQIYRCCMDHALVERMSKCAAADVNGRFTLQGEVEMFIDVFDRVMQR
jgi:glycosyltransferase involved in cell wall biosynthesis